MFKFSVSVQSEFRFQSYTLRKTIGQTLTHVNHSLPWLLDTSVDDKSPNRTSAPSAFAVDSTHYKRAPLWCRF
jgi:hypothetical protein